MEKSRPSWKDYILAAALAVALFFSLFFLKAVFAPAEGGANILFKDVFYGAVGGLSVSVLFLWLKKPAFPFVFAVILWAFLTFFPITPITTVVASVLLGCNALCWLASIPFLASLLSKF